MGLDTRTRDRVVQALLTDGASTVACLAEKLSLTPAAIRRHLDQLADEGAVVEREVRHDGHRGRGRPARAFALTELGRERFEQSYDELATQALRFIDATAGAGGVRRFAEQRASFIHERFTRVSEENPQLTPAEVLAQVFTAEGYAASVRDLPEWPAVQQLCQQHCPVSHVAAEFPQLCEAETAAISSVLGIHVQRLATIAHGDGVCTTSIPTTKKVSA